MPPKQDGEVFQEMHFPLAGLDLSTAYDLQPIRPLPNGMYARTTPTGSNVRTFEPGSGSARGGCRPGIVQYIPAQVSGSNAIQDINVVVSVGLGGLGSGGGYQPPPALTNPSFLFVMGYVTVTSGGPTHIIGFQMVTRLEGNTPLARSPSLQNTLNVLNPLPPPLFDYTSNAFGYQLKIVTVDGFGRTVLINGQTQILVPLLMNSVSGVTYLGTATTSYTWGAVIGFGPPSVLRTTTASLVDTTGTVVPARDASGNPTGTNIQGTFTATVL